MTVLLLVVVQNNGNRTFVFVMWAGASLLGLFPRFGLLIRVGKTAHAESWAHINPKRNH